MRMAAPPKELCVAPFHRLEAGLGGRLQERLARRGAFAGVDFLTPLDLARQIGEPHLHRAGRRPLPRGGDAALASRLLLENRGRLRRLRPPEGVPGYGEAL